MMNHLLILFVYLILYDKVVLNFFHRKHLVKHQVQEESDEDKETTFDRILRSKTYDNRFFSRMYC